MNCANHPDLPVAAFCQNCGKPLCTQCMRSVAGVVYCEPCLAARLHPASAAAYVGSASAPPTASAAFSPSSARSGSTPSPVLAGFLGCIPGVGAMYNGQFVKAFAHVIIFVILISISDHVDAAGLLVAAWVFYQVFDAAQTAIARRDGRPLPDPFGLNDLGQRLGMPAGTPYVPPMQAAAVPPPAATPFTQEPAAQQAWAGQPSTVPVAADSPIPAGSTAYTAPQASPGAQPDWDAYFHRVAAAQTEAATGIPFLPSEYSSRAPLTPPPVASLDTGRTEPIGAIVLIGVGMLFLLSTLGVFRLHWIGRGWPVLIILIGAGLLFSRWRATPRNSPRAGGGL